MKRAAASNHVTLRLLALGDPVRLRLMRLLEREELSVGELASVVQLPQSTVSRHLKTLSDLPGCKVNGGPGLLVKRAEGTATMYRLVLDDLAADARELWVTVRDQLGEAPEFAEDGRRLAGVLGDRRTDTQTFFGRFAGEWDGLRSDLFGQAFTLQAMLTLLPPEWTVADLGCGTGNAAELLAPVVKRVVAVDQSAPMLAAAKKRLSGISNVEFVRGELESLPLDSESVDAAVCVLVLHHLNDPAAAVREMARILKPGGVALIVDMVAHAREDYRHTMGHRWLGFDVPGLIRIVSAAGLDHHRFVVLPSATEARGPGLFACTATRPRAGGRAAPAEHPKDHPRPGPDGSMGGPIKK